MKHRTRKAHLGRTKPKRSQVEVDRPFSVSANGNRLFFRQIWGRQESTVCLDISEALDNAIAREVRVGDRIYELGLSSQGLWIREEGTTVDTIVSFTDIFHLKNGQGFLPAVTA